MPIIENTCFECDLEESMAAAIAKYPQTTAVLVRRHGIYVWGDSWQQAKTQYVFVKRKHNTAPILSCTLSIRHVLFQVRMLRLPF